MNMRVLTKEPLPEKLTQKEIDAFVYAARWDIRDDFIRILNKYGAEIIDERGNHDPDYFYTKEECDTALMLAAFYGFTEIASLLLEKGADTELKDMNDKTALMIAEEKGHEEIAGMLHQAAEKRKELQRQKEEAEREQRGTALFQSRLKRLKDNNNAVIRVTRKIGKN